MEADDDERKQAEQGLEQRREEALGDRLDGADELVLGDLVDDVDQIHALGAVPVALVDGVGVQEAGQAVRPRGAPLAHRHRSRPRSDDHGALRALGSRAAEVVDVARRDSRQALEVRVAEDVELAVQHDPRRQARHLAELRVHRRQQPHVGRCVDPIEGRPWLPSRRSITRPVLRCWRISRVSWARE